MRSMLVLTGLALFATALVSCGPGKSVAALREGAAAEPRWADCDGEEDGAEAGASVLPPVFRAGARLGDPVAEEFYEILEVRVAWIRGNHHKSRGGVVDLLAKNCWVHVPAKGWDWVEMGR